MAANPYQHTRFLKSAARADQAPPDRGREVAFAGRSNSGKSSALNALTGSRGLARTSKTPGRTQLINFFEINPDTRLVDLPGYGFARVPRAVQVRWEHALTRYLETRRALRGLVLLMDIRHPLTEMDRQMLGWCRAAGVAVHVLLTKADKISRGRGAATEAQVMRALAELHPAATLTRFSATRGTGVEAARGVLDHWLGLGAGAQSGNDTGVLGTKKTPVSKGGGSTGG